MTPQRSIVHQLNDFLPQYSILSHHKFPFSPQLCTVIGAFGLDGSTLSQLNNDQLYGCIIIPTSPDFLQEVGVNVG